METTPWYLTLNSLHGYNVLCPDCFKEVKHLKFKDMVLESVEDWLSVVLECDEKFLNTRFKMPCGCVMSYKAYISSWVYVDEFISKPVSKINRAGYLTAFSCSGHLNHGAGYLAFKEKYDDLIDYIVNGHLINILDVEVTILDKDKFTSYSYDMDTKSYKFVSSYTKAECDSWEVDHFTIYLKKNARKSRLDKMIMFRKILNSIAKWCEVTKEFNERMKLGNQLAVKYGFTKK